MRILRVLRGILKTALIWGIAWVPLSLLPLGVVIALTAVTLPVALDALPLLIIRSAVMGAVNGAVFGTVIAVAGHRKSFDGITLGWVGVCGAVGGALFPLVTRSLLIASGIAFPLTYVAVTVATNAIIGAVLAVASLAVARRAPLLRPGDTGPRPSVGAGAV